jgi:hypothetical protein
MNEPTDSYSEITPVRSRSKKKGLKKHAGNIHFGLKEACLLHEGQVTLNVFFSLCLADALPWCDAGSE